MLESGQRAFLRGVVRALVADGHDVRVFEAADGWRAANLPSDDGDPALCRLAFYDSLDALVAWRGEVAAADLVVVGSYVREGVAVAGWVQAVARGATAFYDIDTPVTLAKLAAGDCDYLDPASIPGFDLYLSFTGGPTLRCLENGYSARRARALYCAVHPLLYRRVDGIWVISAPAAKTASRRWSGC